MGLLDGLLGDSIDDPKTTALMAGIQGLLGGRGALQGISGGLLARNQSMQQSKQEQQAQEMRAMQLQQHQETLKQAQLQRAAQERQQQFLGGLQSPQQQAVGGALQGGGGPTMANTAQMGAVDPNQQMLFDAVKAGAMPISSYIESMRKDNSPIKLGAGEALVDHRTYKPLYTNLKEDTTPSAIKEYNFAAQQGYGGSFQQFQLEQRQAGASRTNLNVNTGAKAFETELGKLDAKQLGDYRDAAQTAQGTLQTISNLEAAEKQGAYSGGGASTKLAVGSIINGLTGATPKGFVGSQVYNAEANKLVLDHIKVLGTNPSNADREFIEKTVPQLNTSAEARQQMTDFMARKANQAIDTYGRADGYARKNSGLGGFAAMPPFKAAPDPTKAARTVTRTGVLNGKRVIQYSDGTTEYANN